MWGGGDMRDWISVDDRLPNEIPHRAEYLIIHKKNGVVMEALYNTKNKEFLSLNLQQLNHEVTHWQPLPEPPE